MSELVRRTFRVTLDVTVTIQDIDESLIQATKKGFNNEALANDPMTLEGIARDRRLLATVVHSPKVLHSLLLRCAAESLESIDPDDATLEGLRTSQVTDSEMIERLRDMLSPDDYEYLRSLCEEDFFFDNTSFYQAAFETTQTNFRIEGLSG